MAGSHPFLPSLRLSFRLWVSRAPETASKLRRAGVFSRVDDSNTSIGKRYARNDELGTPFGVTLDFACGCACLCAGGAYDAPSANLTIGPFLPQRSRIAR